MEAINPDQPVPRTSKTAFIYAMEIISRLDQIYADVFGVAEQVFIDTIWQEMLNDETTDGDFIVGQLVENLRKNITLDIALFMFPFHASCAYTVQCIKATETNNNLAWAFAADANFWLGIIQGNLSRKEIVKANVDIKKKEQQMPDTSRTG